MKFYKLVLILGVFVGGYAVAQSSQDTLVPKALSTIPRDQLQKDDQGNYFYYDASQKAKIYDINGEQVIVMDELVLKAGPHFNNQLDKNYYFFLNKKLNRVYPLFLHALQQYRDIEKDLNALDSAEKRKYIKKRQESLASEYENQLKDLTTTEGQVFAKLMSRATGKTVFQIIKELRGGWVAFWWNVKGNMADIALKTPYDPHKYRDDLFVESLLQTNWSYGYLQPYPGAENYKMTK